MIPMSTFSASPFISVQSIQNLREAFPDAEALGAAVRGGKRHGQEILARLWLTEGIPFAFQDNPSVYEEIRGWLSHRLNVHPKEITLVGSARIGYSLAAPPDLGKPFGKHSDLDLCVVSADLFRRFVEAVEQFKVDYQTGKVLPASDTERQFWNENLTFASRNIPKGFFDANKVPNRQQYPLVQRTAQAMFLLVKRLDVTPMAPRVRKASIRIYRDWPSLIDRLAFNLVWALNS